MVNTVEISDVVKVLTKDDFFVNDPDKLFSQLNIDPALSKHYRDQYTLSIITSHRYYCQLLEDWVGRLGNEATLSKLTGLLRDEEFVRTSGRSPINDLMVLYTDFLFKF